MVSVMKIEVMIPEEEIEQAVAELITQRLAKQMFEQYGGGYIFRRDIKAEIRSLLRERMDEITDKAVDAAAASMERKGTKKLLEKIGGTDG